MPPKGRTAMWPSGSRLQGQPQCSRRSISSGASRTNASTASWSERGLAIAQQPSECLVDGAIVWKCLCDLVIENDYIRGCDDALCVLAADQRLKIGALVLGPQLVSLFPATLLHRSSSRLVSPDVH